MASITLQGILLDSLGEIDVGAILKFTHLTTTGSTVAGTQVNLIVPPDGAYLINVEYGQIRVDYTSDRTERFVATVVVNSDSTATSIPELLNASVPPTNAQLLQFQAILADAVTAEAGAVAAEATLLAIQITTAALITNATAFPSATKINTTGYTTSGDGGSGSWKQNGVTGQTVSQSPAQLGDALLNDASGNQWALVTLLNEMQIGGVATNTIAQNNLVFQVFFNAMPATGGNYKVLGGDYTSTLGITFTISNKAITLELLEGSLLPANMPIVIKKSGVYSLPESSLQANRSVRVNDFLDAGNSIATPSARQYVSHITGFLAESGETTETEFRGLSYDIGTNALDLDVEVRGIKGRVYANGGGSNVRGMYSFVEAVNGSGFSGVLTGFLSTVYRNDTNPSESVGIRSHVDQSCTAAFQAAGAGITATDTVSFGYSCRTGSGQPLLATVAYFQAHGGSTGDMFLGYKSNTELDVSDAPFRVKNDGTVKTISTYTEAATIADNGVLVIVAPYASGMFEAFAQNAGGFFGKCYFRVSGSPLALEAYSGSLTSFVTGALTGTTGIDGQTTISADGAGNLYIENRTGAAREYVWNFVGKTA